MKKEQSRKSSPSLCMRLNTQDMGTREEKNLIKIVSKFRRREEDYYIYISLDDFGKIEAELVFNPLKYEGLIIDVYALSGQVQMGGKLGSKDCNNLLSKLPREDKLFKEGALDII